MCRFQGSSRFDIAQGFANVLQRDPADFLLADNRKYIGFQPSGDEGLVALAPAGSSRLYPGPRRLFKATQDNRSATEASHALLLPPLIGRIDSRGELLPHRITPCASKDNRDLRLGSAGNSVLLVVDTVGKATAVRDDRRTEKEQAEPARIKI